MGKKYIIYLFNLFWSHIQKDLFEITDRTKLDYFKKHYTCRPHTAKKFQTLFNPLTPKFFCHTASVLTYIH